MGGWRKLLEQMVADPDPRSYSYEDAARVLEHLGFTLAKPIEGSHRKFRQVLDSAIPDRKRTVIIGLVQKGSGNLKPKYITEMVRALRENNLLPTKV